MFITPCLVAMGVDIESILALGFVHSCVVKFVIRFPSKFSILR